MGKAGCNTHSPMFPGWGEVSPAAASPVPDVCSTAGWRCREARTPHSKPSASSLSSQEQRNCTEDVPLFLFPRDLTPGFPLSHSLLLGQSSWMLHSAWLNSPALGNRSVPETHPHLSCRARVIVRVIKSTGSLQSFFFSSQLLDA